MKTLLLTVIIIGVLSASAYAQRKKDFKCNECHSKNPKIYKMHEVTGFKDCMLCHDPKKFRFGQSSAGNTPTAEQKERMATEAICVGCHGEERK